MELLDPSFSEVYNLKIPNRKHCSPLLPPCCLWQMCLEQWKETERVGAILADLPAQPPRLSPAPQKTQKTAWQVVTVLVWDYIGPQKLMQDSSSSVKHKEKCISFTYLFHWGTLENTNPQMPASSQQGNICNQNGYNNKSLLTYFSMISLTHLYNSANLVLEPDTSYVASSNYCSWCIAHICY